MINQVTLIAENTRFNDVALLDGSFTTVNIQAGNTTAETIELSFVDMASSGLSIDGVILRHSPAQRQRWGLSTPLWKPSRVSRRLWVHS